MKNVFFIFLLLATWTMNGQEQFVDTTKNVILYAENIKDFQQKLIQAKENKQNIHILHIGDSHIQAGFFTSALREAFQRDYGSAGRGLVFPYRLANTNGHLDARFSSDVPWKRYRIITEDAPNSGVAGATVYCDASSFSVQLRCDTANSFNQIEVYGEGLEQVKLAIPRKAGSSITPQIIRKTHVVKFGDVLGKIARKYQVSISQLMHWNNLKGTTIRIGQKLIIEKKSKVPTYNSKDFIWVTDYEHSNKTIKAILDDSVTEIFFIKEENEENKEVKLYSIHLRNGAIGVIYDGIGYNGAKYTDYLRSPLFFEQLGELFRPDLVIISLGTNEAFDKVYALENFRADVIAFCKQVELRTGCKNIVLTTPPSALRNKKYPNKKLPEYSKVIKEVAESQKYAVWDLYQIMKGEKGMETWYKNGLAGKDRVHFTEAGYVLQGKLLYKALTE